MQNLLNQFRLSEPTLVPVLLVPHKRWPIIAHIVRKRPNVPRRVGQFQHPLADELNLLATVAVRGDDGQLLYDEVGKIDCPKCKRRSESEAVEGAVEKCGTP